VRPTVEAHGELLVEAHLLDFDGDLYDQRITVALRRWLRDEHRLESIDGLGFLAGSFCPHYDGEAQREPTFQEWVKAAALPPGWAADDGVALVFDDTELVEAVSEVDGGRAFRVEADGQWRMPVRRL